MHCKFPVFTVDAMEVLIKYCMNSFPQVEQFIRIQISFYFLCVSYWSIGSETISIIGSSKSNRKLINFLSNELINLRKGIGAIFYQHFHIALTVRKNSKSGNCICDWTTLQLGKHVKQTTVSVARFGKIFYFWKNFSNGIFLVKFR